MRRLDLSYPEFGFIVGSRVALGAGLALLLAERLGGRRRGLGTTLVVMGALSTVPAVLTLLGARRTEDSRIVAA